MLKITPTAAQEIRRIQQNSQIVDNPIHLTIKQGGCCGLSYAFEFGDHPEAIILESNGLRVTLAPENQSYLENLKIDYAEDLMGGGFRFDNPQATSTCSCSQSFSLK